MDGFQLAQINIGPTPGAGGLAPDRRLRRGPRPHQRPRRGQPGFVWRFQTDEGNATAVRPYDDDLVLINLSVWTSAEAPHRFRVPLATTRPTCGAGAEWFDRMTEAYVALWWVPAGHEPPVEEGVARLEHLRGQRPHRPRLHPAPHRSAAICPVDSDVRG